MSVSKEYMSEISRKFWKVLLEKAGEDCPDLSYEKWSVALSQEGMENAACSKTKED
jgi:hypothetical protein